MANLRLLDKLAQKYGGRVANLFGTEELPVSLSVDNIEAGNPAYTSGQNVVFDKSYLRSASRADVRGALIHELTHAYGVGATPYAEDSVETYADYARYTLNKNDPNWQPSAEVLAMAEERGTMAGYKGMSSNGPAPVQAPGADNSHQRNTHTNQRTHQNVDIPGAPETIDYTNPGGMAALPALDAASTANYYAQLGNFYALYENARAAEKSNRVGIKAGARVALADTKQALVGDLAAEENAQIDRGTLGGSADLQQRIGIRAGAASAKADILAQKQAGLATSRLADQQSALTLFQNQSSLEADKLAQQQALLASQLEANAIISGAEITADAQTAIFQAIMQNSRTGNGNQNGRNPGPLPPVGSLISDEQREAIMAARLAAGRM